MLDIIGKIFIVNALAIFILFLLLRKFKVKKNFDNIIVQFSMFVVIFLTLIIFNLLFGLKSIYTFNQKQKLNDIEEVNVVMSDLQLKITSPTNYYNYKIDFQNIKHEYNDLILIDNEHYILVGLVENESIRVYGVKDINNVNLINSDNFINNQLNNLNKEFKYNIIWFSFVFILLISLIVHIVLVIFNKAFDWFELKEYLYIFPFGLFDTSNLILLLMSIIKLIYVIVFVGKVTFDLEIIILVITSANIILKILINITTYNKTINYFTDNTLSHLIYKDLDLPKSYLENGYKTLYFKNIDKEEYVLMSHNVNEYLYKNEIEFEYNKKDTYVLPVRIKNVMPFALRKKLLSDDDLYNDAIVRMSDDLYVGTKKLKLCKTSYFDALSTDHIAHKEINSKLNELIKFNGHNYVKNENNEILTLKESLLSNHIGVNTIAITNDYYVVINRQGEKSGVNKGRLVNTGSGSLQLYDYYKNKKKSLNKLLEYGAERELLEETGFKKTHKNYKKVKTKLFGYMRVLNYGGKPDFFAFSVMDFDHKTVYKSAKNSKEVKRKLLGQPIIKKIDKNNIEQSIVDVIDELEMKSEKIAVQLHASREIIKAFIAKGIKLF